VVRFIYESIGAAVLLTAAVYALRGRRFDPGRLSAVAGFGMIYLTLEEVLEIHERIGRWMYEDLDWPDPPLVNHWDDVLVIGIALAGLSAIVWLRNEVLAWPPFAWRFGGGLVFFAAAILVDAWLPPESGLSWYLEESLELAGAALVAWAFRMRLAWLEGGEGALPVVLEPAVRGEA